MFKLRRMCENRKKIKIYSTRLILTRIRFRASDSVAKTRCFGRTNRERLLVRNRMRRRCSGHLFVCSRDRQFLFYSEISSQRRLLLCRAPRRVHVARPWTHHPSIRWLSLVWPRRDVPRRFTWYFFQPSMRDQHDDLMLLLLLLRVLV